MLISLRVFFCGRAWELFASRDPFIRSFKEGCWRDFVQKRAAPLEPLTNHGQVTEVSMLRSEVVVLFVCVMVLHVVDVSMLYCSLSSSSSGCFGNRFLRRARSCNCTAMWSARALCRHPSSIPMFVIMLCFALSLYHFVQNARNRLREVFFSLRFPHGVHPLCYVVVSIVVAVAGVCCCCSCSCSCSCCHWWRWWWRWW